MPGPAGSQRSTRATAKALSARRIACRPSMKPSRSISGCFALRPACRPVGRIADDQRRLGAARQGGFVEVAARILGGFGTTHDRGEIRLHVLVGPVAE